MANCYLSITVISIDTTTNAQRKSQILNILNLSKAKQLILVIRTFCSLRPLSIFSLKLTLNQKILLKELGRTAF